MKAFLAAFAIAATMGIAVSAPASAQTAVGTRLQCLILESSNSTRVLNVCTCTREWNVPISIRKLLTPDAFRASISCNFGGGGGGAASSKESTPHSFVFSKASSYSRIEVDAYFNHGKPKVTIDGTVRTNATGDSAAAGNAGGEGDASGHGVGGGGNADGGSCASGGCQANVSISIH
jgi:hypothetical protein